MDRLGVRPCKGAKVLTPPYPDGRTSCGSCRHAIPVTRDRFIRYSGETGDYPGLRPAQDEPCREHGVVEMRRHDGDRGTRRAHWVMSSAVHVLSIRRRWITARV